MTLTEYIIGAIFIIFVAIMSLKKGNPDKGKDYDQRRDEMYEYYENRMEEFKATEMKPKESETKEIDSSEQASEEDPEEDLEEASEEEPEGE